MPRTCEESIRDDREKARNAIENVLRPRYDEPASVYVRREHLRDLLDENEDLRSQVASLKNDLLDAVYAVRLHEDAAIERHDTAAELEWRIRTKRLESAAAM